MKYRKRLNFVYGTYPSWIEGIGSMGGLFFSEYYCTTCMCGTESVCFEQNDTTLYINPSPYNIYNCFGYITSINELNNKKDFISISPNPTTDEIQVNSLPTGQAGNRYLVNGIDIYNMLGERIYSTLITDYESLITINISAIPTGMYFVEIKSENGVVIKKFVKE
jgi:hypothetical protein